MTAIPQTPPARPRRRRARFETRRVIWLPLLLIPIVVWAAYAVGTPWNESAPVAANLEAYGEPWDVREIQTLLQEHGYEVNVREIKFVLKTPTVCSHPQARPSKPTLSS